jgi:hypothetical protein
MFITEERARFLFGTIYDESATFRALCSEAGVEGYTITSFRGGDAFGSSSDRYNMVRLFDGLQEIAEYIRSTKTFDEKDRDWKAKKYDELKQQRDEEWKASQKKKTASSK